MADFYNVHRHQLHAANGKIRRGELWSVAMREPLGMISDEPLTLNKMTITIVRFTAVDNKLQPATKSDYDKIADWQERHRSTPDDDFNLPREWFTDEQRVPKDNR